MEEIIKQKIEKYHSSLEKKNYLREYLQALILKIFFEKKYFQQLIFTGGTALRFIYGLKRFSEDLDFSCSEKNIQFSEIIKDLEYELKKYNLQVRIKNKQKLKSSVNNVFINFENILYPLGISAHKSETISIKLEIDFNPPGGGKVEQHLINKDFIFYLKAYDLPSLMAGKIHAICFRGYTKGRDFYDLIWYLGKKIEPNLIFLKNAIFQTQKIQNNNLKEQWRELLLQKIKESDFKKIISDIQPFLEDQNEIALLNKDYMCEAIKKY
ncbi:MAG: nucleotidyl transferase AbiEii/AbiGii toxin family protein [Candidatus Margulisbacteria bacterium]|nr:nucleotidyl transferase AbiEii/AbiGii toxin family protein [Candidatus Margulisiibacteriota bacterium]